MGLKMSTIMNILVYISLHHKLHVKEMHCANGLSAILFFLSYSMVITLLKERFFIMLSLYCSYTLFIHQVEHMAQWS